MEDKNVFGKKKINSILGMVVILSMCYQIFSKIDVQPYLDCFSANTGAVVKDIMMSFRVSFSMLILIFGFLLNEHGKKEENDWKISVSYIKRFYINYWMVYVLFSYLVFGSMQSNIYQGKIGYILLDFLGFSSIFGTPTMNECSWIVGITVISLILFPGLKILAEHVPYVMLFAGILSAVLPGTGDLYRGYGIVTYYISVLVIGICVSESRILNWLRIRKAEGKYRLMAVSFPVTGVAFLLWRIYGGRVEMLYGGCLILFFYLSYKSTSVICDIFTVLGEKAVSMMLITGYILESGYREDLIYRYRNPIVIIAAVIAGVLSLTVILEMLKKKVLAAGKEKSEVERQSGDRDERESN